MDVNVIAEYLPLFKNALILTLKIGWQGIAVAFVIGLVGAAVLHFKVPVLKTIITVYIELLRNTPLLVQLFFLYFALPKIGIQISAEMCGLLGHRLFPSVYQDFWQMSFSC